MDTLLSLVKNAFVEVDPKKPPRIVYNWSFLTGYIVLGLASVEAAKELDLADACVVGSPMFFFAVMAICFIFQIGLPLEKPAIVLDSDNTNKYYEVRDQMIKFRTMVLICSISTFIYTLIVVGSKSGWY